MRKTLSIAALVVGLGAFTNAGAAVINGVDWSNVYDPDATTYNFLPTAATPVWGGGTGNATVSIPANYLTISSTNLVQQMYYTNSTGWDMTNGMSVEARVSVTGTSLAAGDPIGSIRIGNGTKYTYIGFDDTKIYFLNAGGGGAYDVLATGLNLSAFTTVRLTITNTLDLNVYVNNSPTPVGTLSTANFVTLAGVNSILFGDASSFVGGTSNWDYIAYTAGVYAVPEPGSMALFGLGLLPIYFVVHRKRRSSSAR